MENGEQELKSLRQKALDSNIETVGKELRGLMHRAGS
jgi:ketol-acid reductoisomerase